MVFSGLCQAITSVDWATVGSMALDAACLGAGLAYWRAMGYPHPSVSVRARQAKPKVKGIRNPKRGRAPRANRDTFDVPVGTRGMAAPRARRFRQVDFQVPKQPCFGGPKRRVEVPAPKALAPVKTQPKPQKRVAFAEGGPQVKVVERWFDPEIHLHRPLFRRLRFGVVEQREVFRYIVPDPAPKLNFPRTKWVAPLPDVEDEEGFAVDLQRAGPTHLRTS
ncbi:hypothetical protein L228DRAFT_264341 [Xylona heveae TC161]|uniref:Uncharacterized protein n=1 Tax=Xylona heveae (strain CBS 132557 / TC161) TaxID=1328760 RepID=A0A165J8R0_XYLHT|nr:hypothetical protein L228DRAFT_264341 [Xylona heveae TC161]KZF25902.1 hypothetical protein L228DRAFT_264341 [Xylona heveae TC161]